MSQSMMQSCRRNKELQWNSSISLARSKVIPRLQYILWNEKVDQCFSFIEDCSADVKRGLPHFTVVVFFLDRQQALKFNFLDTRKSLVTFPDDEIERLKKLLFFASRYHAQMRCTKAPKDYKP